MTEKFLIFGAGGQVGRALCAQLGAAAYPVFSKDVDFADLRAVDAFMQGLSFVPGAVINAAAYTAVDQAEAEEAVATRVNADAPGIIARWCAEHKIPFIHYSTDYVFPGTGEMPWKEGDRTGPLNAYGRGKLAGEKAVQDAGGDYLIFRTSWVYDGVGKNFLTTMLRLGQQRESLSVVGDQYGAPSYAPDIAKATLTALENARKSHPFPSGIYHLCGGGETNWYGFADAIFTHARARGMPLALTSLSAIPTKAYPTPATRPLNSRMDCSRADALLGVRLPYWEDSLLRGMQDVCTHEKQQA